MFFFFLAAKYSYKMRKKKTIRIYVQKLRVDQYTATEAQKGHFYGDCIQKKKRKESGRAHEITYQAQSGNKLHQAFDPISS